MVSLEIPKLEDALIGEIAESADWVVANLDTSISWPVAWEKYEFAGDTFYLIPLTKDHYPAIAHKRQSETLPEARSKLLRFLSAVSWAESAGALVVSFTGGSLPRPHYREKNHGHGITGDLALTYLPEAQDAKQRIALGLMREGRGLNHPAYAFLSFYRVLEAAVPDGKMRENWVADNLDAMLDRGGHEALDRLRASGIKDVGAHLYKSGRMAIAHAKSDPIINPDDASDYDRIAGELPVMRGLAELAIERVLGIKTRSTIYREHLYELAGFKDRLGAAKVAAVKAGKLPEEGEQIDLPELDIELRKHKPYPPLRSMRPIHAAQVGSRIDLVYVSADELVQFSFGLDLESEKFVFDWSKDLSAADDGSAAAALHAAALTRLILEYIGNGELHVYDSETRVLLSRVEAFLPVNYWANHERLNQEIEEWTAEASRRATTEKTDHA